MIDIPSFLLGVLLSPVFLLLGVWAYNVLIDLITARMDGS